MDPKKIIGLLQMIWRMQLSSIVIIRKNRLKELIILVGRPVRELHRMEIMLR